jgi:hypothetical protein
LIGKTEGHMLKIVRLIDNYSLPVMRRKLRNTNYAIRRLEDILYNEMQLRKSNDNFEYIQSDNRVSLAN